MKANGLKIIIAGTFLAAPLAMAKPSNRPVKNSAFGLIFLRAGIAVGFRLS